MAAFELGDRECGRGWQNAVATLLTFDPNITKSVGSVKSEKFCARKGLGYSGSVLVRFVSVRIASSH